jgi:mannose-1-phosphate guanylyltransferase
MNKNNYCVIMAGGVGSRFWPLSRSVKPKQFLDILGTGKTLLRQTFERFTRIIPLKNILVVTSANYGSIVKEQIPELDENNILLEPLRRNTAPCIAYASYKIRHRNPNASIIVAPSDHLIIKEELFIEIVKQGLDFVRKEEALLTLGIIPSRPETGYGYIQVDGDFKPTGKKNNIRKVKTFTEKPDYELAKVFVESGEFYWNSGIFFWSLPSILNALERYLPDVNSIFFEGISSYYLKSESSFISKAYAECKNISIDYGIMEEADNVYVLTSDFGWSDLGTWGSLYDQLEKKENNNSITGNRVITYDLNNCLVNVPDDKLVVLQGLNDYIIVESDNILLVCRMEDEQKIRNFVNDVKMQFGDDFI